MEWESCGQDAGSAVWQRHAGQWARIGAPLRPSPVDGAILLELSQPALVAGRPRVVVMGVTPEVVGLAWPADSEVLAFDHSAAMIASVWRRRGRGVAGSADEMAESSAADRLC